MRLEPTADSTRRLTAPWVAGPSLARADSAAALMWIKRSVAMALWHADSVIKLCPVQPSSPTAHVFASHQSHSHCWLAIDHREMRFGHLGRGAVADAAARRLARVAHADLRRDRHLALACAPATRRRQIVAGAEERPAVTRRRTPNRPAIARLEQATAAPPPPTAPSPGDRTRCRSG
jgi:hypothetical protein